MKLKKVTWQPPLMPVWMMQGVCALAGSNKTGSAHSVRHTTQLDSPLLHCCGMWFAEHRNAHAGRPILMPTLSRSDLLLPTSQCRQQS